MSKKYLIFLIMVFIMAVGAVSAQSIDNDAVIGENQDLNDLSTICVDSETADILQEADHASFVIDNSTSTWQISVLDDDGNYVYDGTGSASFKNQSVNSWDLNYQNPYEFSLYQYYDYLPGDVTFTYSGDIYDVDNMTVYADALTDSIQARDIVDESSFSATFFDENGDPLDDELVFLSISGDYYYKSFYKWTAEDGVVTVSPALPVGNYTVGVENRVTKQSRNYWWNLTKPDESKFVEIRASQDEGRLIVSAVDKNGNNVTGDSFTFISEDMEQRLSAYFWNDESFVTFSLYHFDCDEYPQNIRIVFNDASYYPANTTVYVEKFNDSIVAHDAVDGSSFSAALFDFDGNPYTTGYARFHLYVDGEHYKTLLSYTDDDGVATMSPALPVGNYIVDVENSCTSQFKKYRWNITKLDESKFVEIKTSRNGSLMTVNAVNKEGKNITEGYFKMISKSDSDQQGLYGSSDVLFNLYVFDIDEYPQNLTIEFTSDYYYPANVTFFADLNTSILADDVVDEFSFNVTFLDNEGNPLNEKEVQVNIDGEDYYYSKNFYPVTDSEGRISIKLALPVGTYSVSVFNHGTGQSGYYLWNITKEDESKNASIRVTRDNFRFLIEAYDNEGNIINNGSIIVQELYHENNAEISNGTAIFVYDNYYSHDDGDEIDLTFTLDNPNYYPVNAVSNFTFVDTVDVSYSGESTFNATFYDMDGNPLKNQDVLFTLYDLDTEAFIENITMKTDPKGFASIETEDEYFGYNVVAANLLTYQYKSATWNNKKEIEITPVADYDYYTGYYVSDNETMKFKVSADATGKLIYSLDSYEVYDYTADIVDGEFSVTMEHSDVTVLRIKYPGDNTYSSKYARYYVFVKKMLAPTLKISENAAVDYKEEFEFEVNLKYDSEAISNASVEIEAGDNTYNLTTDENGLAYLPITWDAGVYNVTVSYAGEDYLPVNKTTTLTINKISTELETNPVSIAEGEDAVINVTLADDANGKATASINGENYSCDVKDGKGSITIPGLTEGNYTVLVTYCDDINYLDVNGTVNVTVGPAPPKENLTLEVTAEPVTAGENLTIVVEGLKDATGNVTASVNGENYTAPVENGKATIVIPDLDAGNYTVPVSYSGDDKYNPATEEVNVTVEEDKSIIISAQDVTKYYRGPERFVVTVTDYEGNPLENKTVSISINGAEYTRTTNATGEASMALGLNSGVYNVTSAVDNRTVDSLVTILTTVNGTDIVKMFRNATQYYATFLDSNGNYLANGTDVKFNINGVMYERKVSGDKGLARLNINLEQGEYVITAINPETGENAANNITVLAVLTENRDLTKYYRNASQYTVKVLDAEGNPVGANQTVRFNINGVFYERKTNESGMARLNLNLQPGDYVITAEYNGCMVSNNVTILPVLSAEDLTKKYGTPGPFVAKLVDGQGNPYADQKVEFNIHGVFYYRTTNSSGEAKLNINLMAGEYIITSSYNGASIANKVTIES